VSGLFRRDNENASKNMTDHLAYSRKQWVRAVNLSALLGWACIAIPMTALTGLSMIVYAAIYGLPISFLCCWVIGAPILKRLMRREITWVRAAFWGGGIALLISLLSIVIGRYRGWRQSLDPSLDTNFSGGTHLVEVDGFLTAYGWLMVAQSTAVFTVLGTFVAVLVWSFIGDPASRSDEV